ncbi:hypothetical protein [Pseudomonas sp. NPDC008258]|uniref:hypothetical protein n=1 Tax=Pseudomonas sp. NPDC008258 TaxID=3364418 RepID=UPI0036EBAE5A
MNNKPDAQINDQDETNEIKEILKCSEAEKICPVTFILFSMLSAIGIAAQIFMKLELHHFIEMKNSL